MTDSTSDVRTLLDRAAIRDLVDRYAHCADRRDPHGQAAVFAEDGQVQLFEANPSQSTPIDSITGRAALAATFGDLIARYEMTTYLNGQSTVSIDGDHATGETYCLAYHLLQDDGQRMMVTMGIRYLDVFERSSRGWLISRRDLIFDWTDRRPSQSAT